MDDISKKYFNGFYITLCFLVFVVICLRAFFIPFSHDEASTFFFYVQSDNYLPYKSHVYTNNHVLNSALANICYHLAGSHRFVLRIPNVLSFILLCIGVFKFFKYLNKTSSKIVLTCFFILTFNFLDFFELCRGYGLSMGFMVLGLSYLQDYFYEKKIIQVALFSICLQLALAANLVLVIILMLLLCFVYFFQIRNKLFFNYKNIFLQLVNAKLLFSWIKFSFYYKNNGVLDSGFGENYWEVSFKSLMNFIFGTDAIWMQVVVVILFVVSIIGSQRFIRKSQGIAVIFKPYVFYLIILIALIISFYLQKKLLKVNYPEDRTGLFFYVFFALSVTFFIEKINVIISALFATVLMISSLIYFFISFDLLSFTNAFYHVLPKDMYTALEDENKKSQQLFTIGGNRTREMDYAFLNYRAGGLLNPMDEPMQMHMNCDYYIALMAEKPFYRFFYDEIGYDARWHRVLLKRRKKIARREIAEMSRGERDFSGKEEYSEFLRFYDSAFVAKNCIEADVEINFKKVPKPFKAFLVLQVNDLSGNVICYKRALLNWLADDLSGQSRRIKLTSGPLSGKYKNIVVYVWNIDKKECILELKQLKMFNLSAPGINIVIPKNYYPYVKNIIKEELL